MSSTSGVPAYPSTRVVDAVAGVGDAVVDDPYQWLERDTEEVRAWQSEQNTLARDTIRAWPHYAAVRAAVLEFPSDGQSSIELNLPVLAGDDWFEIGAADGVAHPVVRATAALGKPGRTVVDPKELTGDDTALVVKISPAPDGRFVACWILVRGDERVRLHVVDVATGRDLLPASAERFDSTSASAVWLPDGSGFYCNPLSGAADEYRCRLALWRLDGTRETVLEDPAWTILVLTGSAGGEHVLAVDVLRRAPVLVKALPDGEWRPTFRSVSGSFAGALVGSDLFVVTTNNAPRGRLVRIPLASTDDESTWTVLVPESDAVLTSVSYRAGVLVVHSLVDTYSRFRLLGPDGTDLGEIPLPEPGSAESAMAPRVGDPAPGTPTYLFRHVSFGSSRSLYEFDVETRELRQVTAPEYRLSGVTTRVERCVANDGTPLTYHLVHRDDLDLGTPHPVLAHAYGDGGASWVPRFLGQYNAFLRAGGIYVHPNLRGGGEYGEAFFRAGTLAHKNNTFLDLHAIAEDMIAKGRTEAGRIGIVGESSGGLLAGAVVTQRPDLYGVAIPRVPILDLLRVVDDPYGLRGVRHLFGDPTTADGVRHLAAFSPCHLVRPGTRYPAVLVECGAADHRCPPWHGRKLAARLQAATTSDRPVLLRVWSDSGHGVGIAADIRGEQCAEWLSFAMMALGMTPNGDDAS